jgi:hypothetical protein
MKPLFFLLMLLITPSIWGQVDYKKSTIIIRDQPPKQPERIVLIVDTFNITLDSTDLKKVDTKWIKKITVVKDEKHKTLHGDKDGIVMIYTKKKYQKYIRTAFGI